MAGERDERTGRIKAVERQYETALFAARRLADELHRDPTLGKTKTAPTKLAVAETLAGLAPTYIVRMFAEFESGLRSYRRSIKPGKKARTEHLIDAVASRRKIEDGLRVAAHAVRTYRNALVHEDSSEPVAPLSVAEVRRHLMLFFGHLPYDW